jgi:hypothetical protein
MDRSDLAMEIESIQLDREDVILLILEANERLLKKVALNGVTRLEKLLFLLDRETDFEGIADFFYFEPHHFGPFSKEVYEATEFLSSCELIEIREKSYSSLYETSDEAKLLSEISDTDESGTERPNVTEKQFVLTDNGRKVARIMRDAVAKRRPADIEQLDRLVLRYANWPLNHLIRYVYRQHPDMTVKSVHPEAQHVRHAPRSRH